MKDCKSLSILGRQPALGIAELESLYGAEHVFPIKAAALLDVPAEQINFKRLGGSIKIARILTVLPYSDWPAITNYLMQNVPGQVAELDAGKFTLGLSVYGVNVKVDAVNKTLLQLKKVIRQTGRSVRIIQNKTLQLNSATVLYNKLTHRGAWELLLVENNGQTILAQTLFVQDVGDYAGRDQARPKRDPRVGMLPPKLAQIIINLATGPAEQGSANNARIRLLDPFCGTGVILQEALLMGYRALGTDLEPRMVEYSKENLDWLAVYYQLPSTDYQILPGDATNYKWSDFDCVASEVYLGRPYNTFPAPAELVQTISDANTIIKKFLINLLPQLKRNHKICLAVPAWQKTHGEFIKLPLIDHLTDMGYNRRSFVHASNDELVYSREGQVVARQLIRLEKK